LTTITKNINKFNDEILEFAKTVVPNKFAVFIRKIALELLSRVVLKTPVDTGRARGNWQLTVNWKPDADVPFEDEEGNETINRGNMEIKKVRFGDTVFLTNNVSYVLYLEEGTDRMAPAKMLAGAIEEVRVAFERET